MSLTNSLISLNYGAHGCFSCEVDPKRIVATPPAPQPNRRVREDLRGSLEHPLDFPPMEQAVIPGDRVVLALDRATPGAPAVIAEVWRVLQRREVRPQDVLVLQPGGLLPVPLPDPRGELPHDVREHVRWKIHDPTETGACAYLAATTGGDRIYLAREVTEADFVISIGQIAYDPVLGYRGGNSVFYPGLSTFESFARALGQGHHELRPSDDRPLRQLIDEVAWLLGTQFSIQVVPAAHGGVARAVAGAGDSVYRHAKRMLDESWMVRLDARTELVVAAIDVDAAGHGWEQVGATLQTARNLVCKGGKIVILSELQAPPGAGLEMVRGCENPLDAIQPLRAQTPPDLIAATQLAGAVEWADVYLLSELDSDLVEDLFMVPVEDPSEVVRLLGGNESCAFLDSAQHTYGEIRSAG